MAVNTKLELSNVTIYQNGMLALDKNVILDHSALPAEPHSSFSITIKKDYLADALGSLSLHPSEAGTILQATTANKPQGTIHMHQYNPLQKLIGSTITIGNMRYTVVSFINETGNSKDVRPLKMVVMGNDFKVEVIDVESTDFFIGDDVGKKVVMDEIAGAKYMFNAISTMDVLLNINSSKLAPHISYTIPSPAYKFIYSLHAKRDKMVIIGQAYVVNESGEDWKDISLDIDTKNATVFDTDLLDQSIPKREKIMLANANATSAIEVQTKVQKRRVNRAAPEPMMMASAQYTARGFAMDAVEEMETDGANHFEEGDKEMNEENFKFSVKEVSIKDGFGALVNLFDSEIIADVVIYGQLNNTKVIPYNIIMFNNTFNHALFRGLANIYIDGKIAGKAIMPHTGNGDNCILTYEVSNALKVEHKVTNHGTSSVKLGKERSAEGTNRAEPFYSETVHFREEKYLVQNVTAAPTVAILEYDIPKGETTKIETELNIIDMEDLFGGKSRFKIDIPANSANDLTVKFINSYKRSLEIGYQKKEIINLLELDNAATDELKDIWASIEATSKEIDRLNIDFKNQENDFKQLKEMAETSKILGDDKNEDSKMKSELMDSLNQAYREWTERTNRRKELNKQASDLDNEFRIKLMELDI